jgi:hypothetical protein
MQREKTQGNMIPDFAALSTCILFLSITCTTHLCHSCQPDELAIDPQTGMKNYIANGSSLHLDRKWSLGYIQGPRAQNTSAVHLPRQEIQEFWR